MVCQVASIKPVGLACQSDSDDSKETIESTTLQNYIRNSVDAITACEQNSAQRTNKQCKKQPVGTNTGHYKALMRHELESNNNQPLLCCNDVRDKRLAVWHRCCSICRSRIQDQLSMDVNHRFGKPRRGTRSSQHRSGFAVLNSCHL